MGDPVICTLISLLWIPPAFMALLLAAYVYLSWSREDDLLKKDRKRRHIKYPAILFIASILLIPALSLLTGSGIMNSLCQKSEEEIMPPNCHILNEFSDGSNKKTIDFPEYGSFNSETKITLPRTASVKNASITFKHEPEAEWKYEFNMWGGIASSSGIDLDTLKGCAYIKMKKLEVDSSIVLDGTHSFDEVRVKKGGMITTSPGKNLHLRIKGALTIDEGGMINLDGKSSQGTGKASAKKEVGNFYGSGGGGGGHGGAGGKGGDDKPEVGGSGGAPYGLSENPIEPGSCGANGGGCKGTGGSGVPGAGGAGGGAIKIEAQEAIIAGYVTANGLSGTDGTGSEGTGGGGGGSGGSIIISADSIIIKGGVKANGGTGGAGGGSDGSGGGGSGGRILMEYKTISGESRIEANGGTGGNAPADKKGTDGSRGTIVYNTKKESGISTLIESSLTSKTIKPDNIRTWKTFRAKATAPSGSEIRYAVLNASDNSSLCAIRQEEAEKGFDIESCASNASEIALRAEFTTISVAKTPLLCEWSLEYETEVKDLAIDAGIDHIPEYSAEGLHGNVTVSDANTEPKISAQLTSLAKECTCNGCVPSGNDCTITMEVSGESSGSFTVENPEMEYCT